MLAITFKLCLLPNAKPSISVTGTNNVQSYTMSSTKRRHSADSAPETSKREKTTRRVAVPNHSKKVQTSTLHVSSNGRIGRKKLKVEKEVLVQPVPDSPIDTVPNTPTDTSEPLSSFTECELDPSILDGQESPSESNAQKKSERSNTTSVNFLLSFAIDLFLTPFADEIA